MAVYYVDFTTGDDGDTGLTEALAWQTISKINGATFAGDDQILFKCGEVWRETLIPPTAGTSGHQITFGAYGTGAKPLISGADSGAPTTPVRDSCIYDTDARGYITIDGLELAYAAILGIMNDQWTGGAEEVATPSWIVQNCTLTKCGVRLFGPGSIVQDNTLVGPQPTTVAPMGAVEIRGAVAANCSVLRNTIYGFYGRGIWFMTGADSPTANDNIIHDIAYSYGSSGEGYGINFDGYAYVITGTVTATGNVVYNCAMNGIEMENCSGGSLVRNNLVHDCALVGIYYLNYAAWSGHYAEQRGNNVNGVVAYNVVYHCRYAVEIDHASGIDIWNNVLYDGVGASPVSGVRLGDAGTPPTYFTTDIDIRNNIIGSGMTESVWTKYEKENHLVAFDYNRVENPTLYVYTGSVSKTLAQLQAEDPPWAVNCFTDDPLFVDEDNHDFRLQAESPCINAGIDVGLTTDYAGNSIVGLPDIGAYEYIPASEYHLLKRYGGAAWLNGKMMAYGGAAWEQRQLRRWDGDSWVDVDGLGE